MNITDENKRVADRSLLRRIRRSPHESRLVYRKLNKDWTDEQEDRF